MIPNECTLLYTNKYDTNEDTKKWDKLQHKKIMDAIDKVRTSLITEGSFISFVAMGHKMQDGKERTVSNFYFDKIEEVSQFFPYDKDVSQDVNIKDDRDLIFYAKRYDANYTYEVCAVMKSGKVSPIGQAVRKARGVFYRKGKRIKRG